jgi:hypothetical protein
MSGNRRWLNIEVRAQKNASRLWKAARQAEHKNPRFASFVSRIEWAGLSLERALAGTIADSSCELKVRELAARLLRDVGGHEAAFVPLLKEFIVAGDAKNPELCSVIQSMNHAWGHLTRPEFEILLSTLRSGTPEQRYWVVNEIAFFTDYRSRHKVRQALIETLDDRVAPDMVRAWAAERLHLHISQETVRACLRAIGDPDPEVRLWAVYTLGVAASQYSGPPHPMYRHVVGPALERLLADDAVAPGWWSVRREAQSHLPSVHGSADEEAQLQAEIRMILKDPATSFEDKRWASFNDCS